MMFPILYPVNPDDWFVEFRQWLWWAHHKNPMACFIATSKLVDPLTFPWHYGHSRKRHQWDHPEYIYSTFAPWVLERMSNEKDYYDGNAIEDTWHRYVGKGAFSVGEMAQWCNDIVYHWVRDVTNPWGLLNRQFEENIPRSDFTQRQRLIILHRDGFRCQMCGAAANEGSQLHVDHAIPKARGGLAQPWNLWTLCRDCNMGKLDRVF